ncbi:MAG: FAD-dependent oxidoreductase, partial [Spirochaetes bacterium]|nr:FAD-dependent oxidoreductase [Spirochaetota bacterium]
MKINSSKKKTVIIGAGLGGLVHGILLKKAQPDDEVVIYDANKIPGGFCTAFQKATTHGNDKVKYTINIPLITSDFGPGEPFDTFLKYIGVKNIEWKIINNFVQYYPLNNKPFLVTKNVSEEILEIASSEKEKQSIKKFFKKMEVFYNDIFYKAQINPTALQAIKMLFKIPKSVLTLMDSSTYLELINKIGIKTDTIKEILSVAEAFFGIDVDKASGVGELLMIHSFLSNNSQQPAHGYNFQDLSDRLADRFKDLGGKLVLNTKVDSVLFDNKKARGVLIKDEKIEADNVILAVAQDRIKELIESGSKINKISKLLKKIKKLPFSNSDYYCYYLIDKKFVDNNPQFVDIAYHVYKLPEGMDKCNWKLAMWIYNELYNNKYYIMGIVMFEQDQKRVDEWMELREKDYEKYKNEKEKISDMYIKQLQQVEPAFKKHAPAKSVLVFSPASYMPYGSKYPISGLAQTPQNCGMYRMEKILLNNLFISGGASFSAGLWPAIAGGWQSFVASYEKIYGTKIGNHDV